VKLEKKIRPKHTGDNGGTVKTQKTKNWPVFLENQRGDFWVNFADDFCQKSVNGTKKP
jgi:hypothetical protein